MIKDTFHRAQLGSWLAERLLFRQTMLVESLFNEALDDRHQVVNLYDDGEDAVNGFLTASGLFSESALNGLFDLSFEERSAIAHEAGFEPALKDIYEWWLVTPNFADQLKRYDEPVFSLHDTHWWGRTTTGQSVDMDDILVQIASDADVVPKVSPRARGPRP